MITKNLRYKVGDEVLIIRKESPVCGEYGFIKEVTGIHFSFMDYSVKLKDGSVYMNENDISSLSEIRLEKLNAI